jgi:hypothetical protein
MEQSISTGLGRILFDTIPVIATRYHRNITQIPPIMPAIAMSLLDGEPPNLNNSFIIIKIKWSPEELHC